MTTSQNNTGEIPGGTRVLNTTDGEAGTVLNGYARDAAGCWREYEVETTHAIEIWKTADFIRFDQMNASA